MRALLDSARNWLNAGLALIYPEICQVCQENRATPAESFVCGSCRAGVRLIKPPFCRRCGMPFEGAITTSFECANCAETELHFSHARSAAATRDPLLEIIHRYKYQRALWFEPFLAQLLIEAAGPELAGQSWDGIVPVPLYPAKQREREFNQAERLARRLSAATGIPLETKLLRRVLPTRSQTQLSREERAENVRHAFAMRKRQEVKGRRIVLVDDVMTTGATTSACARVLRRAGAAEVCVWTVARGI
jgi:ComF family protein